ncbi:hypothetical protein BDP67DRAFT_520383 [Colletotrichum lupini]|nr:hypothetical protein BDP67DRAFT_520383 [Colletotrichum lupini]
MGRLDLQHHICLMTLEGRIGLALPCQAGAEVGRVLHLGTGTGIWAIEFGDDHPEAEVSSAYRCTVFLWTYTDIWSASGSWC